MNTPHPRHPKGNRARILLTSVFGPYAQDDEYGSRRINHMELYQNQVTRIQGGFSLRMFHPSFALRMLQANTDAPCTVLDYPTLEDFTREVRDHEYDVVGISSIVPNTGKVKKMCEIIRAHRPGAVIVGSGAGSAGGLDEQERRGGGIGSGSCAGGSRVGGQGGFGPPGGVSLQCPGGALCRRKISGGTSGPLWRRKPRRAGALWIL